MLKRLRQALLSTFNSKIRSNDFVGEMSQASNNLSIRDLRKIQARATIQFAMQELSNGKQSLKEQFSTDSILPDLLDKDSKSMSAQELELLARIYASGLNGKVTQDPVKACQLLERASELGSMQAKVGLATFKRKGRGTAIDPQGAFKMYKEVIEKSDLADAHLGIASMYSEGEGIAKEDGKALFHYKKAVAGGVVPALYWLGRAYEYGLGVGMDEQEALQLYYLGASCGDPAAKTGLAKMFYEGKVVPQDRQKAFELHIEAANQGFPLAMYNTATQYYEGEGIEKDVEKSRYWYEKSAVEGYYPPAAVKVATMYIEGLGVEKDIEKAVSILGKFSSFHDASKSLLADIKKKRRRF